MEQRLMLHIIAYLKLMGKEFGYDDLNEFTQFVFKTVKTLDSRGSVLYSEHPELAMMRNMLAVGGNFLKAYYEKINFAWVDDFMPALAELDNKTIEPGKMPFGDRVNQVTLDLMKSITEERTN